MDNRVYNILNWETDGDSKEFALIDIQDHSDRKFFWNYWHTNKDYLKSKGFSVSKNNDGNFYMYHVFDEEQLRLKKEKQETLELSRSSGIEEDFPKPEGLDYFPYQKSAIAFANGRDATLIADEPGLGKTIEVSGIINSNSDIKTVLVICPASLRINWKRELEKWLINSYSVGIVDKSDYPENVDIVIINYDVVHRHHEELLKREWDLLVIDEVHFLKSPKSRRHKYVFGSNRQKIPAIKSKKKVFLTGTPIVNKPIELFPIIHNLDSVKWNNQWKFAHRYCDPKHNGYGWDFSGASNLEELQEELRSSVMIRRLKKDVLSELPAKFRQVIELPYSSSVAKLIGEELSEWSKREELIVQLKSSLVLARVNEDNESYASAVESLKAGVSESFGSISRMREKVALAKVPYVVEHLKSINHKVVVFAHHKSVVKKLAEEFEDECVVLVGDTSMKDRQLAVDEFQNNDNIKFFIGSIMAAGVGITLTSSSHVVFAELDWVPGNVSQAEDRCHRVGQKDNVLVQHLVLESSLDAKIAKTLINKQEVIDKALDLEYSLEEPSVPDEVVVLPPEKELKKEAELVSDADKVELLNQLKFLASFDGDNALASNGVGFNKFDTRIGSSLASQDYLTNRQAVLARKLLVKYANQLTRLGYD